MSRAGLQSIGTLVPRVFPRSTDRGPFRRRMKGVSGRLMVVGSAADTAAIAPGHHVGRQPRWQLPGPVPCCSSGTTNGPFGDHAPCPARLPRRPAMSRPSACSTRLADQPPAEAGECAGHRSAAPPSRTRFRRAMAPNGARQRRIPEPLAVPARNAEIPDGFCWPPQNAETPESFRCPGSTQIRVHPREAEG